MSKKPTLKPCPFCGDAKEVEPVKTDGFPYFPWQVWCMNCGARAPRASTKGEAIKAWNTREERR